jgi:hypothetical protein
VLIAVGGAYDLLTPALPSNLAVICRDNRESAKIVRELLRALGAALIAIGTSIVVLLASSGNPVPRRDLIIVLLLVLPTEGINALGMYRVRSPYQIPLAFAALTVAGVVLTWSHP